MIRIWITTTSLDQFLKKYVQRKVEWRTFEQLVRTYEHNGRQAAHHDPDQALQLHGHRLYTGFIIYQLKPASLGWPRGMVNTIVRVVQAYMVCVKVHLNILKYI